MGQIMKKIKLTQGKFAIVDDKNFEWLNQFSWQAVKYSRTWYATRRKPKDSKYTSMHRLILDAQPGEEIDHKNHNGLDNRECNIRKCTKRENQHNRLPNKYQKSKYKGVHWHSQAKKWKAQICVNNEKIHIGMFDNEDEAALAYNEFALDWFGKYAYLNKIKEQKAGQLALFKDA